MPLDLRPCLCRTCRRHAFRRHRRRRCNGHTYVRTRPCTHARPPDGTRPTDQAQPWSAPLSRELLVFNSFVRSLTRALRSLLEVTSLNMLLRHDARRARDDLLDVNLSLPFQSEVNTGFGVLAKVYLDALTHINGRQRVRDPNAEGVREAKQMALDICEETFQGVKYPKIEVERGFRFWDVVRLTPPRVFFLLCFALLRCRTVVLTGSLFFLFLSLACMPPFPFYFYLSIGDSSCLLRHAVPTAPFNSTLAPAPASPRLVASPLEIFGGGGEHGVGG